MLEELNERWEKAGISNDFFFGKVMQKPALCKRMLEIILGVRIERIEYAERQKTISIVPNAKGIRLDVYVQDEKDVVYDVEIQTTDTGELPKRSRYYQSIIDLSLIERGISYSSLKKSFVIFICTFDVFGLGRHVYTFENRCREEPELVLQDETVKIFLNAKGTQEDVGPELKAFLDYIAGRKSEDPFVRQLDEEVQHIRSNQDWRRDFMKWHVEQILIREEGRKEGRAEGRKEGRAEGRTEGREEGRKEGRAEVIAQVLSRQKNIARTADLLGYPAEEVWKVAKEYHIPIEDASQS